MSAPTSASLSPSQAAPQVLDGLGPALIAYMAWGLLPLYLRLLHGVPPLEFVGWRTLFTLPIYLAIIALRRQGPALISALTSPRSLAMLALSASLIGGNWLLYIWAVTSGHLFATSLGYYINPLINIVLGTLFMGETLRRRQWLAVVLASLGVVVLALGMGQELATTLGIAFGLAISFAAYGLVRRLLPVGIVSGLTIEAGLLALPAVPLLWSLNARAGLHFGHDASLSALLAFSGVATAVPLLMFAQAARRLDFSVLGFAQFITPTTVFLLGLLVFHERLRPVQLASFVVIWVAAGVFCWDLRARR